MSDRSGSRVVSAVAVLLIAIVLVGVSGSAAGAPAPAALAASSPGPSAAQAKAVAACGPGKIAALRWSSGSTWQISQIDAVDGAPTTLATVVNPAGTYTPDGDEDVNRMDALALTAGGLTAYLTDSAAAVAGQSPRIHKVDLTTGTATTFTGAPLVSTTSTTYPGITAGAIDPASGIYYYAHAVTSSQQWRLYAWDTSTDTPIGQVGSLDVAALRYGDLTFDAGGNLIMTTSSTTETRFYRIAAANVPRAVSSAALAYTVTSTTAFNRVYGTAWSAPVGSFATPSIFLARLSTTTSSLLRYDPAAGTTPTVTSRPVQSSTTDLASCVDGDVITLGKQVTSRLRTTDQFTWTISRGAATASATSTGTALGTQPERAILTATPGTYTLTETGAGATVIGDYTPTLTCTQRSTGSIVPTAGSGVSRTLTYSGGAVDCLWSNRAVPTLTVTKALPQGRYVASDQFTVALRTGSPTGTVVSSPTNATSTGTGTTVTPGSGTTGAFRTTTGTTYHLTEAAANPQTLPANYTSTITCHDPSGLQTGLPTNLAFANNFSLQVVDGAQVECTITNTKKLAPGTGLSCGRGEIYASTSAVTSANAGSTLARRLLRVLVSNPPAGTLGSTTAGAASQLALPATGGYESINGIAVSSGGRYVYYVANQTHGSNSQPAVMRYDSTAPAATWTPRVLSNPGQQVLPRGGLNPVNGIFYLAATVAGDAASHDFWAFDTLSDTTIGYVGRWTGPSGANGDLVFDQSGNMIFIAATATNGTLVRVANMPTTAVSYPTDITSLVSAKSLVTGSTALANATGASFDNDGYLYVSVPAVSSPTATSSIRRVDPNDGSQAASFVVAGMTDSVVAVGDLADCNDPGAIRLKKNLLGRVVATDQFSLVISPPTGGTDLGNRATTSGSSTGIQPAVAGPIVGVPGRVYTLTETATSGSLANYDISLRCTDLTHNVDIPVTAGATGVFTVTFPALGADNILADLECVLTNAPTTRLTIQKALGSPRIASTDQFSVYTRLDATGSTWLPPVAPSTGRITQGTGNTVTLNSGTTGPQPVTPGARYRYGETGAGTPAADVDRYITVVTCTDSRSRQPGLPSGQPYEEPMLITPVLGALITCTLTNSVATSIQLSKALAVPRIGATDQFVMEIRNQAGTVVGAGTATTTGSGSTVTAGTGSRLWSTPVLGQSTTLREVMAAGSTTPLSGYDTRIDCENGWIDSPTVLPSGAGQSFTVVPVAGDRISCLLINDAVPILRTEKALLTLNGSAPVTGQTIAAGDALVYRISVTNTGKGVGSTTVSETVPVGTRYNGPTGVWTGCTTDAPAGTVCTRVVSAPSGPAQSIDFVVTADADLVTVAEIHNTVSVSDGDCPACTTSHPTAADLGVTKQLTTVNGDPLAPGGTVDVGDELLWTVTVLNRGGSTGTADLIETVPAATTFAGPDGQWGGCVATPTPTPAGTACTRQVVVPAAAGGSPGSVQVTFAAVVMDVPPTDTTHVTNVVAATGASGGNLCATAAVCQVGTPLVPAWTVEKTVTVTREGMPVVLAQSDVVWPGEVLDYTVTATALRGTVSSIELFDDLGGVLDDGALGPATLVVNGGAPQPVSPTGTAPEQHLLAAVGSLTARQTAQLRYAVTVGASAWGATLHNRAVGTGSVLPQQCNGFQQAGGGGCVTAQITPAVVLVHKLGAGLTGPVELDGSAFALLSDDSGSPGDVLADPAVTATGTTGRFAITGLEPGTYWLRETRAPVGHTLLAQDVQFVVEVFDTDPRTRLTITDPTANPQVTVDPAFPDVLRVVDNAPFELPFAGGSGTGALRWFGMLLLAAALALAVVRRRREVRPSGDV